MSKLLWLTLLWASICGAQDIAGAGVSADFPRNRFLIEKDLTLSENRMIADDIVCQITNGADCDAFRVSVVCQLSAFKEFGIERINNLILLANRKAQATLESHFHYLPSQIRISYNPALKDWTLTNTYCVRDRDGNISEKLLAMDFDSGGAFKVMKRIY